MKRIIPLFCLIALYIFSVAIAVLMDKREEATPITVSETFTPTPSPTPTATPTPTPAPTPMPKYELDYTPFEYADLGSAEEMLQMINDGYAHIEEIEALYPDSTEYTNYYDVVNQLDEEITNTYSALQLYVRSYNRTYFSDRYPTATTIWIYLKDNGFSDEVCAGILGNIMAECGGGTLSLSPYIISSSGFYGICQWSSYYYPQVYGASLSDQLSFLVSDMPRQINSYGSNYYSGFCYDAFLEMDDCRNVANAFAKCYERCAQYSITVRMDYADVAYATFAGRPM